MNDLNRASHDAEIERIHDELAKTDPSSEAYGSLVKNLDILIKTANEDDKIKMEAKVEELKLEAEADESRFRRFSFKVEKITLALTPVVTVLGSIASVIIICKSNEKVQKRSIEMEMDGFSHTDRSDKFILKAPMPRI